MRGWRRLLQVARRDKAALAELHGCRLALERIAAAAEYGLMGGRPWAIRGRLREEPRTPVPDESAIVAHDNTLLEEFHRLEGEFAQTKGRLPTADELVELYDARH